MSFTTLINTETLAAHLDDPDWVIFDCRFDLTDASAGLCGYIKGHILGARYAHLDNDLASPINPASGRHPLPDPKVLARKLGQWGVDEHKQVIVYDNSGGAIATRLWWLLRWLGHKGVALLDGGLPKWQREGRPVNTEEPKITPTMFQSRRDDSLWVNTGFVEEVAEHGGYLLLDTRDVERFRGEVEPLDKVAGHIPGSANRPLQSNLDRSGCLLPAMDLRQQFIAELKGIGPERVIATCGSGVTACHHILAMEHAGLRGAKLYAGSWSEWIRDSKRAVAKG